MAEVIVTLKIMPENPEVDFNKVEEKVKELVSGFGGEVGKVEIEPIAFGLNALKIIFIMDESKGSTESLEKDVSEVEGVMGVEVVDVRRTLG